MNFKFVMVFASLVFSGCASQTSSVSKTSVIIDETLQVSNIVNKNSIDETKNSKNKLNNNNNLDTKIQENTNFDENRIETSIVLEGIDPKLDISIQTEIKKIAIQQKIKKKQPINQQEQKLFESKTPSPVSIEIPDKIHINEAVPIKFIIKDDSIREGVTEVVGFMSANLKSDEHLRIESVSSMNQIIIPNRETIWHWNLIPVYPGNGKVILQVAIRYRLSNGNEEKLDYPQIEKDIEIIAPWWYKIKILITKNLDKIAGFLASIGVFTWLKNKFFLSK